LGGEKVYKLAVCDDEPHMLEELSERLSEYMEGRGLDCQIIRFDSSEALLESGGDSDLLLLDIQMEPMDGMKAARLLRARGWDGLLIFTTVLREAVFDAFEMNAFDYLLKPLDEKRFSGTLDRAIRALEDKKCKSLMVQSRGTCRVVPFSQIVYCEVMGRKVYIHQRDGEVLDYYERIENLAGQLDGRFFRCHRSYLVNLDCVLGCREGMVSMDGGDKVPVSRLREKELVQALLAHMRGRRR